MKPLKPPDTLKTLMAVYQGYITSEEAAEQLNLPVAVVTMTLFVRGDEFPTLYTALTQLKEGRITHEEAAKRLNVTRKTLYSLQNRYGTAPKQAPKPVKKPPTSAIIRDILAGNMTITQAATHLSLSKRSIYRLVRKEKACSMKTK